MYWMLFVAGLGIEVALVAWIWRRQIITFLRRFFTTPDSPFNLALFRIALFSTVMVAIDRERRLLVFMSGMPSEAVFPVPGMGWVTALAPIDPHTVGTLITILNIVCVTGIVGLSSRLSALVAFALTYYLFGVYNCFGSIAHIFHVLTLSLAALIFSRCGDALSLDAFFMARRRADRGDLEPPEDSVAYGLPLRVVWVTLGLAYFFPGLWKLAVSGPEFVRGDYLRYLLWKTSASLGIDPVFPIDRVPGGLQVLGTATILWELGFLFCIFFGRTRWVASIVGTAFHLGTWLAMSISFAYMNAMYVSLVDWARGLRGVGRWLFRDSMLVVYDGNCGSCRRTIASIRTLDLLGRVQYVDAHDSAAIGETGGRRLEKAALMHDIHVIVGDRVLTGYEGYRRLVTRIPPLWPIWPLLHLPPVAAIGRRVYRQLADSRTCRIVRRPGISTSSPRSGRVPIGVAAVGVVIASSMIVLGVTKVTACWPVACFPTFCGPLRPVWEHYERSAVLADGTEVTWPGPNLLTRMKLYHSTGLVQLLCAAASRSDPEALRIQTRLPRLVSYWATFDPLPPGSVAVRFRSHLSPTEPSRRRTPSSTRLVYEYALTERPAGAQTAVDLP